MAKASPNLRNAVFHVGVIAVEAVVPVALMAVLSRRFAPVEFGLMAMGLAVGRPVYAVAAGALRTAMERSYFQYAEHDRARLVGVAVNWGAMLGALGCVLLLPASPWLAHWLLEDSSAWLFLEAGMLAAMGTGLIEFFLVDMKNRRRGGAYALVRLLPRVAGPAIAVALVFIWNWGILAVLWAQAGAALATVAAARIGLAARARGAMMDTARMRRELFAEARPIAPTFVISGINGQIDRLLLAWMETVSTVGVYQVASQFSSRTFDWMTALQNVYQPTVYEMMHRLSPRRAAVKVAKEVTPFFVLSMLGPLLFVLWGPEVVTCLMDARYHGAVDSAIVLSLYYAVLFLGKSPQLYYARRYRSVSVLMLLFPVCNIVLAVMLVPWLGAMGMAMALLGTGIITGVAHYIIAQWAYYVRWPVGRMLGVYACLLGAAAGVLAMRWGQWHWLHQQPVKVLLLAAFVGYVEMSGMVSVRQLAARVRRRGGGW